MRQPRGKKAQVPPGPPEKNSSPILNLNSPSSTQTISSLS
jgi:hypothetical protein